MFASFFSHRRSAFRVSRRCQGGGGEAKVENRRKMQPRRRIFQAWIRSVQWSWKTQRSLQVRKHPYAVCFSAILSTTSSPLAIPCLPALTLCHRPWEPLTIDLQRPRSLLSQPSLADPLPPLLRAACPCPFCALRAHLAGTRRSCTDILHPLPFSGVGPPSSMMELAA